MKWVYFSAVLLATLLAFVLIPDHVHAQVWIADGYLILAYLLIPRKPQLGWIASMTGNMLCLYPIWILHRPDLLVLPAVFTVLATYNTWNALKKISKT